MVNFWQVLILLFFFGIFLLLAFYMGYNAGLKKEHLIKEKELPEPINFAEEDEEETE